MRKKQIVSLLLASAAVLCLGGCGSQEIAADTLSIDKSGSALYTIVSDFSADYYDLDELKAMAESEVAAYGAGVQIMEAAVEEQVLHFQYGFTTLSDYAAFMGTSCYQATVRQALAAGYKADTEVISVKDGSSRQMKDDVLKDYQLFIWNEGVNVRVDGRVLYYSGNLSVQGKTDVIPKADASGPYYVIYK